MLEQKRGAPLTVGIVGLGLIGGSMAKALKKYTTHRVYGCDIDSSVLRSALEENAIDETAEGGDLSACDVIFAAMYPKQTLCFVRENIRNFRPGCILMDFCGVKRCLVGELTNYCAENGVTFVGGHPMAGRECWGFSGSDADLFQGASMIVTPNERTPAAALSLLERIFTAVGFARITTATAEDHDSMIAFTSQLAHVVSSAYIKSPRAMEHKGFSAGSYKDLTRVAKLNPQMWTELFLENADDLSLEIDTLIHHLQQYRDAIAAGDGDTLYRLLDEGRKIKEELDQ